MIRKTAAVMAVAGLFVFSASAQLIFNAQSGGNALFQQSAGTVSQITAGLSDYGFPSISRNGRFVVVSGPDPSQPLQPSTDLWLIDRVAQTTTRIVNHTTTNLMDGSIATVNPSHSELRPDNLVVAVTDQVLITVPGVGSSVTPQLNIYRVSDGFYLDLVKIGMGDQLDLTRSEFVGISWLPDGSGFATPDYNIYNSSQSGSAWQLVGITFFSYDQALGTATKAGVLSVPFIFDQTSGLPSTTHIFPAFSPDGTRLAYFEISWPNAVLSQQATARLIVANANGSSAFVLANFIQGKFPQGLTWSADGSRLIFSLADQVNEGGVWLSAGNPASAIIWSIDRVAGGPLSQPTGVNAGYLPNYPPESILSATDMTIQPFSPTQVLIQAAGLPGSALFGFQSSTDVDTFGPRQNFSGSQLNAGIIVTPAVDESRVFRLLE